MGNGLQRLPAIDAIRGLALFGILYVHLHDCYNGYPSAGGIGWWNEAASWVYREVFLAKAYLVFSFLFGLGFALQLGRAEARGVDFRGRFLWRLVLLLAFGMVNTLFYGGDILMVFAVFGAVLVPCWRVRSGVLAGVALLLTAQLPRLADALCGMPGGCVAPLTQILDARVGPMPDCMTSSWAAIACWNMTDGLVARLSYLISSGRLGSILAMLLWGLLVGRCGLATGSVWAKRFWVRCAAGALVALGVLSWVAAEVVEGSRFHPAAWEAAVGAWKNDAAVALFLSVCFLVLDREALHGWFAPFRAAGRMSLSCYIGQSVVGTMLLFGWGAGLAPRLTALESALWCAGLFALQACLCRWWLRRYRFGPLEWLWRSATYGRVQPWHRLPEKNGEFR